MNLSETLRKVSHYETFHAEFMEKMKLPVTWRRIIQGTSARRFPTQLQILLV